MPIELSYIVLFMPAGTIVDGFVIFFFLEKHYIPQNHRYTGFLGT